MRFISDFRRSFRTTFANQFLDPPADEGEILVNPRLVRASFGDGEPFTWGDGTYLEWSAI